MSPSSITWCWC